MTTVKVAQMTRRQLDWCVAVIETHHVVLDPMGFGAGNANGGYWVTVDGKAMPVGPGRATMTGYENKGRFSPSTSWAQAGPYMEVNPWILPTRSPVHLQHLGAFVSNTPGGFQCFGTTPLLAAMRAIVTAGMGTEVDLPESLMTNGLRETVDRLRAIPKKQDDDDAFDQD